MPLLHGSKATLPSVTMSSHCMNAHISRDLIYLHLTVLCTKTITNTPSSFHWRMPENHTPACFTDSNCCACLSFHCFNMTRLLLRFWRKSQYMRTILWSESVLIFHYRGKHSTLHFSVSLHGSYSYEHKSNTQ